MQVGGNGIWGKPGTVALGTVHCNVAPKIIINRE